MKVKNKIKFNFSIFKTNLILPAITLSLGLLLLYIPFLGNDVRTFDRTLGNAILNGIDITKRINNISFFNFILVPIIFFLIYLAISILCKNTTDNNKECINFINIISIISLPALIFAHINKYSSKEFLGIEVIFPCFIIVIGIIFLAISEKNKKLNFDVFKWSIFAAIPIALLIILSFKRFGMIISIDKFSLLNKDFSGALNYILNIGLLTAIFGAVFIAIFLIITLYHNRINFVILKKAYIPVVIAPIVVSLFLEFTNILNQYSIFINSKFKITCMIYLISGIIFWGYYLVLTHNKNFSSKFCFEKYYYPILLVAFSIISVQIPLVNKFNTDLFEQSNHGTSVSEFFNFSKLPIIETFDAHMLQNQIGRYLYGILNNDYQGAIFLGYSLLPIYIILFYFLFVKFFDKDIAFCLMILYPITSEYTFTLFTLAPFVILSFLYAYRTKKYRGYVLYWISIAITCLFRLDMGFSIALASIVTWSIMYLLRKGTISVKKLSLSCLYVITCSFTIFIGICLIKSISPLQRIMEFLKLCQSNINWAYSSLGNTTTTAFVVCYFMIPSVTAIMIIILIFNKWKDKEFVSENKFIITLIIGLVCIFNFSRGIVRHSLVENTNVFILSSSLLFISMFIYIFKKKNMLLSFILSNVTLMIVIGLTMNPSSIFPRPLINSAISRYLTFENYSTTSLEKTERVVVSDEMKRIYLPIKGVFDKTLLPNETYIDFTNQTLLYAMTSREKPMYVNQSPGLLSGEYTQQRFIEECEQMSEKVPFVLMPIEAMPLSTNLDGIQNSYRYYLISEYIGNNFKPLFRTSKFAIWCRNDRFDEKAQLVSKLIQNYGVTDSSVLLSDECKNILTTSNESLSVVNNELILKSTNVDPILMGLEKLIKFKETTHDVKYIKLSIEYESDKDGLFELFYTTDSGESFGPHKVVSKNMAKTGVFEATVPYTKDTSIRFDIPENSTVKIKNIRFKEETDLYEDDIKPIDYNYASMDYHSYHLINIPYIWANYDKIGVDKKEEQLTINRNLSTYDFSSINKQVGNYLLINASAVKDGTMTVQFGKEDTNGFTSLSQYDFSVKNGNKQNYLIRLSSDFMWYSGEINAIKIISDNNSTVERTSILKGDTLK
jgi:hypothetical protein